MDNNLNSPTTITSLPNQPPAPNQENLPVASGQSNKTIAVSRAKLIAYFLIGLLTNFFGLLIGGLWIAIKVKENKKQRFLSLLAGVGTAIIITVIFNILIVPALQQTLINKYPEMAYIPNDLKKYYPNTEFGINIYYSKDLTGPGGGTTTSTLTVSAISNQNLSAYDRKQIGERVCNLLNQHNASYNYVEIAQVKVNKILIFSFNVSLTEKRACREWQENPF